MARPRKTETMELVTVRLPKGLVEEIDRYTAKLEEETPLLSISRADTIRYLLRKGLRSDSSRGRRRP